MINNFKKGIKDGIPIAMGYLSVSFTFGIIASSAGIPIIITVLISMTNLTSAGQLAGINIIAAGGSFFELILSQVVINMRYALMSLGLSQKFHSKVTTFKKCLLSFGNTDEIFAVSMSQKEDIGEKYFCGLMILPYIFWTLGTFLGCISGSFLPQSIVSSLSIALYAMFIAIIIPPAKTYKPVAIVLAISIFLSCVFRFTPILNKISSGFSVIIIAVISCVIGALLFPIKEDDDD